MSAIAILGGKSSRGRAAKLRGLQSRGAVWKMRVHRSELGPGRGPASKSGVSRTHAENADRRMNARLGHRARQRRRRCWHQRPW